MAGYSATIRKARPWRLRIKQWTDETGAIQDPADFDWQFVADTNPALNLTGVVDSEGVLFSRTAGETALLKAGSAHYAVKATPPAGDAVFVLEGRLSVQRTSVS